MYKELIQLANEMDRQGLYAEADKVSDIIRSAGNLKKYPIEKLLAYIPMELEDFKNSFPHDLSKARTVAENAVSMSKDLLWYVERAEHPEEDD